MRKIVDFIGANLFMLAILLMGLAAFAVIGVAINALAPDPDAVPWAWAVAVAAGIAAMLYGGRWLHRLIERFMRYSAKARAKSGERPGSTCPGSHHHS